MGFSEAEKACKEHPYHNQKQGVCPSCLRERLSRLYVVVSRDKDAVSAMDAAGPSSSSTSSMFASSSKSISSTHHHHHLPQRNMSDMGSISFRVSSGNGLKKSRSIAFVSRSSIAGEAKHASSTSEKKKKKGFWSKLLDLKGKNRDEVNFDGKMAFHV